MIHLGNDLLLSCDIELSSLDQPSYSWKKFDPIDPTISDSLSTETIIFPNGTLFIPDVKKNDEGTYICIVTNNLITMKLPTIIIIEGLIAEFIQKPLSYLCMPTLSNAYYSFELSMSIKPENGDGLILYNGQNSFGTGDFISIGLVDSYVEFRFELGGGATIIRSANPIELYKWHSININRNKHIGKLKVDKQDIVASSSNKNFVGLDLSQPLYIGAVPSFENVSTSIGFSGGFTGCISRFQFNNQLFDLIKNSTYHHSVGRCKTCLSDSCLNGGTCQENTFQDDGFECTCLNGFSGKHCHLFADSCHVGLCNEGHCLEDKELKFICQCPFGRIGRYCEKYISIIEPLFTNGAYFAFRTPPNSLNKLAIKIRFKPNFASNKNDHLLLYCGQYTNGTGDYAALAIVNRSVEFRFDTGSGPAIIHSPFSLTDNEWTDVVIERNEKEAFLTVADQEMVSGITPGKTVGLNLKTLLYLGGYNKTELILPPSLGQLSHFEGCISRVFLISTIIN